MSDTEQILTQDEELRLLGDNIIASLIQDTPECIKNRSLVFGMYTTDMFKDENYLIYYLLYRFRESKLTPDAKFLELFFMNNSKVLKDAGEKLDLTAFVEKDVDEITSYIAATSKHFTRLQKMRVLVNNEFMLTLEKYKLILLAIEASKIYGMASRILVDGVRVGRKDLMGYPDSKAYINREFARLDAISNREAGEGFVQMRGFNEIDDKKQIVQVSSWGITELDKHFGGIYSSKFISILAPPKNGKTKLCAQLAHRTSVLHGNGIVVWALEGGRKAFDAQLRSKHFNYMYNSGVTDIKDKKIGVDAETIKNNAFKTDQLRQLEDASRIDLYNNPNYGEVLYIEKPCNVETFIDELDTAVQTINAKVIVMDYLQLIGSESKNYKKNERIGDAYIALLKYINTKNITIISPAQYTQEFLKEIAKTGAEGNIEVRGAGGESAEIIRTPDINIALWASAEDLIRGQMSFLSVPSRGSQPFPKLDVLCDLSCCDFYSKPEYMKGE